MRVTHKLRAGESMMVQGPVRVTANLNGGCSIEVLNPTADAHNAGDEETEYRQAA